MDVGTSLRATTQTGEKFSPKEVADYAIAGYMQNIRALGISHRSIRLSFPAVSLFSSKIEVDTKTSARRKDNARRVHATGTGSIDCSGTEGTGTIGGTRHFR